MTAVSCPHCSRPMPARFGDLTIDHEPWAASYRGKLLRKITPLWCRILHALVANGPSGLDRLMSLFSSHADPANIPITICRINSELRARDVPVAIVNPNAGKGRGARALYHLSMTKEAA